MKRALEWSEKDVEQRGAIFSASCEFLASNCHSLPEVEKGDGVTMKIGDRFKDKTTGKIYIIRMEMDNETLCLEGENGLGRRLTGKRSLKRTCDKLEGMAS